MSVIRLSSEALRVLESGVEVKGSSLRITQQLDRKLYTAVNKVLEALGLKWSRKEKAHVAPARVDVGDPLSEAQQPACDGSAQEEWQPLPDGEHRFEDKSLGVCRVVVRYDGRVVVAGSAREPEEKVWLPDGVRLFRRKEAA